MKISQTYGSAAELAAAGFTAGGTPGKVLGLFVQLREHVGSLAPQEKELANGRKLNFKIRPADVLIDRIRPKANELGLLIYPARAVGKGEVLSEAEGEGGTYAEVLVRARVQAVEDGSYLEFEGFGLGADGQDKAGGKAGTYAWKQALLQALLAGGGEDTDDDDAPVKGGPKKKATPKPKAAKNAEAEALAERFSRAASAEEYRALLPELTKLAPDAQVAIRQVVVEAKARCIPAPTKTVDQDGKPSEGAA